MGKEASKRSKDREDRRGAQAQIPANWVSATNILEKPAVPRRVALYARRSTNGTGQEESLKVQLDLLEAEAERQGWRIVGKFRDTISGATPARERPAFRQLLGAVKRGEVNTVAVAHFDRLGRTMRDMVETYNLFKDLRVGFVSLAEPFLNAHPDDDFSTAPLIASILSWASEYNRRQILARTAEGRERAMARGVRFGRAPLEIDREKLERLRARGVSVRGIAKELGVSVGKAFKEIAAHDCREAHTAIAHPMSSRKK